MGLPLRGRCASLKAAPFHRVLQTTGQHTMAELSDSLERMSFMQLLLLFGFVICYVLALGGLFGSSMRLRAAVLALLLAAGFTVLTDPWVHGALLVAFVVAGLGLFVGLSWLLARLLAPRAMPLPPDTLADTAGDSDAPLSSPPSQRHGEASGIVAARRARATR
jgi:hypothetical protein